MARILIVTQNFTVGGLETHILTLSKFLHAQGHKLFIATSEQSDLSALSPYLTDVLQVDGWVPTTGANVYKVYESLLYFIEKHQIELLHLHPHEGLLAGGLAAQKSNLPYVVSLHSPLNLSPVYGSIYRMFLFKYLLPSAQKVYCVSYEVEDVLQNVISTSNYERLLNPIDTTIFSNAEWDQDGNYVLISRIDKDKLPGVKEAIRLVAYIKEQKKDNKLLYIVGDGEKLNDLKDWVSQRFNSPSWVHFEGKRDNTEQYIRKASIVFGMGRVAIEAGAMNIPIILTGYNGIKGFLSKENVESFARRNFSGRNTENVLFSSVYEELKTLYKEPQKYQIKSYIHENYAIEKVGEKYLNAISSLANTPITSNWSEAVLSVISENKSFNIFDMSCLTSWLDHVDFGLSEQMKLLLSTSSEIKKVMEEKSALSQQLGMVNQHLHDISVYKNEHEAGLQQKISQLEVSIEQLENEKKQLMDHSKQLEDEQKQLINYSKQLEDEQKQLINYNKQLEKDKHWLEETNVQSEQSKHSILFKLQQLSSSKSFRLLHVLRRGHLQFLKGDIREKKEFLKWGYSKITKRSYPTDLRYHPFSEILSTNTQEHLHETIPILDNLLSTEKGFDVEYKKRQEYYRTFLNLQLSEESLEIIRAVRDKKYKGIIVYPAAVNWEPVQRPQQILRELASRGYLCFFCYMSNEEAFKIEEKEENLFILNKEAYLLPVLRAKSVIVLCSWLMQMAWADLLPHKFLWYDVLDQLEFLSLYDEDMQKKHNAIVEEADIVSYSARNLQSYINHRKEAIYLPNAVCLNDFLNNNVKVPEKMKQIINKNKPIIGYFGAIEEWFDTNLIESLAQENPDWQFVFIGKVGLIEGKLKQNNIHLLGQVPYKELISYASQFDVAIIPFKVNDLTNCVSPVKFFEYCALGIPIVSTPIEEMKQYEREWIKLGEDSSSFTHAIRKFLLEDTREKIKEESIKFLEKHLWSSRVDEIEIRIEKMPNGWKALSNFHSEGKVATMAATFLDFEGENFYSGGAERYLIDLDEVCSELGLTFTIYQYGNFPWIRRFRSIDVVSLSRQGYTAKELSVENISMFNRFFYEQVYYRTLLNVYSAFFEAWPVNASPSIGISHGIAWDHPSATFKYGVEFWETNRRVIESAKLCDNMVSVDTNTANWFQTIDYETGKKMSVIPNYVDLNEFTPRKEFAQLNEKVIILYPRRLYAARGLYIVLEILDSILEKFPYVEFHFVGKGFEEDTCHVIEKQKKWGSRVQWYSFPPERMPEVYKKADISLIPTMYSEGTSLSCLEAMASGNAVISTRIGGLTDLVINNYNGYLVEPSSKAVQEAIEKLLAKPEQLLLFKKRSVEVAKAFSKKEWKQKWKEIIKNNIDSGIVKSSIRSRLVEIYVDSYFDETIYGSLIVNLLKNGCLVYIRLRNHNVNAKLSFDRVQWMGWDTESFSNPDLILAEKLVAKDINKNVDVILTENWQEDFEISTII
ncbi:glycosyltransferase [Aneurinibacillus migulanus]|uniref:glycosyltransferase n=1 Tax=Aneurinibacillus migulanus TaxID=47500 RepID=UPI002E2148B0|nr:glycosyltransferase [Aneurinibacillus migulanus]MED4730177.1 glycosyltransferase [Aneurinibacillus migulanus]